MVKTPHKIESISASLPLKSGQRVRVDHVAAEESLGERGGSNSAAGAQGDPEAAVDPAVAAMRAWAMPLDYPPLADAIVPGDRVAIVVDPDVPCVTDILRGSVESLEQAGMELDGISIVTTTAELGEFCQSALTGRGANAIQHVVHDPRDERNLCFVGVTPHGVLLINRTIFDADVVLPIGCARLTGYGVFDSMIPQLCDEATVARYRLPAGLMTDSQQESLRREANEAGWLVGAPFAMRVVPGGNDTVAHVLAGETRAVAEQSLKLCRRQWLLQAEQRASLVIATVTGGAVTQTWQNIARALAAAGRVVEEGGAIAICSNLNRSPGKSLGRLVGANDWEATERKISQDRADDTWTAWELAKALQRGPVYLLSLLDAEAVEDMGLAPVTGVEEIVRLASRHDSYAVLDDSQHVSVTVRGES
ncbi:MAG: lactate racemase domain-containing protein [Planctomycetes bacterium]|nr:lactate racemase domain-containing protein [Planctomycetota bacterium]